jgi:Bacterial aa3 type cytochrome c oxidase subunit IV
MAIDTSKGHPSMDYAEHVATYRGFLKLTQYGIVFLVLLLLAMFMFLVPAPH